MLFRCLRGILESSHLPIYGYVRKRWDLVPRKSSWKSLVQSELRTRAGKTHCWNTEDSKFTIENTGRYILWSLRQVRDTYACEDQFLEHSLTPKKVFHLQGETQISLFKSLLYCCVSYLLQNTLFFNLYIRLFISCYLLITVQKRVCFSIY